MSQATLTAIIEELDGVSDDPDSHVNAALRLARKGLVEEKQYASINTIPVMLQPATAMQLLRTLKPEDGVYQIVLDSEAEPSDPVMPFSIWSDGCETVHQLLLKVDGSWIIKSYLPI